MAEVEVVETLDPRVVADELWPLYDRVFGDVESLEAWRTQVWEPHAARAGFRLALARDGDRLVGFGYGYTGERGQWWTDTAATVMPPAVAADWLGGHFELVSIGVDPGARGAGVGRRVLDALTADLPQSRWLLMTTSDPSDPARRLYRSCGWAVVSPGFSEEQVVLGRAGR